VKQAIPSISCAFHFDPRLYCCRMSPVKQNSGGNLLTRIITKRDSVYLNTDTRDPVNEGLCDLRQEIFL
jgi:hypothetical protein